MSYRQRVTHRVRELIGNARTSTLRFRDLMNSPGLRYDYGTPDYAFYARLVRGKARGYELSGAFGKPMASKLAGWVLGDTPRLSYNDQKDLEKKLNLWYKKVKPKIIKGYKESLTYGDSYLVFNGDASLTVVPPHLVEPIFSTTDPGALIGWEITESFPSIGSTVPAFQVVTQYTAQSRIISTRQNGTEINRKVFNNPLRLIPVIHIPGYQASDEFYGRSVLEGILPILRQYNNIFEAGIKGNIRQGRPTPVIEQMGSPQDVVKFWEKFSTTEEHLNPRTGQFERVPVVDFDPDRLMTLANQAKFSYQAPGSFSADSVNFLGLLFYLLLQNSEIPEYHWGASVASSKASVDTQEPPFIRFIQTTRGETEEWVNELMILRLRYQSILDITSYKVDILELAWPELRREDGDFILRAVQWAKNALLIQDATATDLLSVLKVPDAEAENKAAMLQFIKKQKKLRTALPPVAPAGGNHTPPSGPGNSPDGTTNNERGTQAANPGAPPTSPTPKPTPSSGGN